MADEIRGEIGKNEVHHGENIRRLRAILNVKQDLLAFQLGSQWSQKKVSLMEARKELPIDTIHAVAAILQVTPELITGSTEASFVNAVRASSPAEIDIGRMTAVIPDHPNIFGSIAALLQEQNQLFKLLLEKERHKQSLIEQFLRSQNSAMGAP